MCVDVCYYKLIAISDYELCNIPFYGNAIIQWPCKNLLWLLTYKLEDKILHEWYVREGYGRNAWY